MHLNDGAMRHQRSILLPLFLLTSIVLVALLYSASPVTSQTPNQNLTANIGRPSQKAIQLPPRLTPTPESSVEVVKIDVDLVKIDALVLQ